MRLGQKEKLFLDLMRNFIEAINGIEAIWMYDREGLLISKYARAELSKDGLNEYEREEIYGAFASIFDPLLKKINSEYKIGELGSITFETQDHHIIFIEAGPKAIVLIITMYDLEISSILPYCYLFVEKVVQIIEESFDLKYNTLMIPKLIIGNSFDNTLKSSFAKTENNEIYIGRKKEVNFFKLIIIGDAAVGKTSMISRFVKGKFSTDYRPTLGISITTMRFSIQGFEDSVVRFLIFDLAGQEFFKRVRRMYYTGAQAVFVVYDITRRETFEGADFWFEDAKKELGDIPFVLIGNKIDLENERQISTEEGMEKAKNFRCTFVETSVKTNVNIQDTFKILGIGMFFRKIEDLDVPES